MGHTQTPPPPEFPEIDSYRQPRFSQSEYSSLHHLQASLYSTGGQDFQPDGGGEGGLL